MCWWVSGFEYLRIHVHASMHECEKSATVVHVLVCVQMCAHVHVVCMAKGVYVCACGMCFCLCEQVSSAALSE